ncbi:peptidase M15 [Streptomyces sp. WAC 01529]|uniref:M15 family metallopeptidase n=1 Tax=Streptomyces sp. WAC 01529 TaxID=2203205 RepID=UPI000F72021C|nr:M15 family metallopeptidase [Streptomyces sp. WAC 01529]AZM56951.1 peptidase M15 [Streptomyces sp. WAC 01529]
MNQPPLSARTSTGPLHRRLVVGVAAVIAAIAATLGYQAQNSSSSPPSSHSPSSSAAPPSKFAHGAVPDGTTVFDEDVPAVAKLDPELLEALRRAAEKAASEGVSLYVNGGWRSPRYQERLLREAIAEYGSEAEAARWVATAKTSPHVSGEAVDIGRSPATAWLSEHGAAYGLCQIYRNEPWHYELRPEAIGRGCPQMYADPTQDPRMQK